MGNKGQVKGNKETKKPKAEKEKTNFSAYQLAQGKGMRPTNLTIKKP